MLSNIKDILIITTSEFLSSYQKLFGNGNHLGLNISYKIQDQPNGLSEAFILGEDFIKNDNVCLILGDNIFYGHDFINKLRMASKLKSGGIVFGYHVDFPEEYGVLELDSKNSVISVEEKPKKPKSNYAIPGLYFFDNKSIQYAKNLKPSKRGELEIIGIMQQYMKQKKLKVQLLGRGITWLDTGTPDNLMEAISFVHIIEKRQGLKISCIEEVAYKMGFIDLKQLSHLTKYMPESSYSVYLKKLVQLLKTNQNSFKATNLIPA